jgi:transcriptional regulator with XRE-family HTH domain
VIGPDLEPAICRHVAGRIVTLREQRGLTAAYLAGRVGLDPAAWLRAEAGSGLSIARVILIAHALQVTPAALYHGWDA